MVRSWERGCILTSVHDPPLKCAVTHTCTHTHMLSSTDSLTHRLSSAPTHTHACTPTHSHTHACIHTSVFSFALGIFVLVTEISMNVVAHM